MHASSDDIRRMSDNEDDDTKLYPGPDHHHDGKCLLLYNKQHCTVMFTTFL